MPRNARRAAIATRYDAALAGTGVAPPARRAGGAHVFHQYVLRVPGRAAVQASLRAQGVGTGVHYPVPVHCNPPIAAGWRSARPAVARPNAPRRR